MIEKSISRLTATRLRIMLIAAMVLVTIVISIGFYFLQSFLYKFAVEVSHANENATTSANDVATFIKLERQLEDDQVTIKRVESIVAESKSYQYQNQIINDLNTYAARAGLKINGYTFSDGAPAENGGSAQTAAENPSSAPVSGLKSTAVTVALSQPTKYQDVMEFVRSIEQNLTKMQLSSLVMAKGVAKDEVTISALEIEVYIK